MKLLICASNNQIDYRELNGAIWHQLISNYYVFNQRNSKFTDSKLKPGIRPLTAMNFCLVRGLQFSQIPGMDTFILGTLPIVFHTCVEWSWRPWWTASTVFIFR